MKKYWQYLKYVLKHKNRVFKRCMEKKLYVQAFTHDLSKFSPLEFIEYAKFFYGDKKNKEGFKDAWDHHQVCNKHHWNYWTYDIEQYFNSECDLASCKLLKPRPMPVKYIREMIADWEAMSDDPNIGGSAQKYYLEHYYDIELERETRTCLEYNLGLMNLLNAAYCECNWEVNGPISEIVEEYSKTEYGTKVLKEELFIHIDKAYRVNTYNLLKK